MSGSALRRQIWPLADDGVARDVERLHLFFVRHGGWVVFVFRFMPAFRT